MYFKSDRRFNILDIAEDFAHLRQIHKNGDLEFELFYRIAPSEAISNEAMIVNVNIFTKTSTIKPLFEDTDAGFVDTEYLVKNIRTRHLDIKGSIKQQKQYDVVTKKSDVSSKINNETIGQLRAGVSAPGILQNYRTTLELVPASTVKATGVAQPVLQYVAHNLAVDMTTGQPSLNDRPAKLMQDMILRQGIDPTYIFDLTNRSVPAIDSVGGIIQPMCMTEVPGSPATKLLGQYIFPSSVCLPPSLCVPPPSVCLPPPSLCIPPAPSFRGQLTTNQIGDGDLVQVMVRKPETHVEISVTVIVPFYSFDVQSRNNTNFFAKFELINGKTKSAIDSVTKPFDVAKHAKLFNTPRRPPIVKATKSNFASRTSLEIKQVDPGAKAVQVFKKNLFHATPFIDDYRLIGTYHIDDRRSRTIQVDLPKNSSVIYRVVPLGDNGTQGFEFTNVVVKAMRYQPVKSISLVTLQVDIGVKLEARQIPQRVVAIEFKSRNLTTHETEYTNIGDGIVLIDDSVRTADYVSIIDRSARPNNIYEYVAKLIYDSGTTELAGNATVEFNRPAPGKVDTVVNNIKVNHDKNIDVSFEMNTTVIDSNIDIIKTLLEKQGIFEQFKNDVQREREFLKNLIAHNVQRVNLTTGAREDFGVVTVSNFSDVALRKNQAIQPLEVGNRYRYEITALLRAPETMFESFVKSRVDSVTKKTYSFNPSKFLHPLALSRGILMSPDGLKTRYSKEAMSYGVVGAVEVVEVTFDEEPARITEQTASRFDRYMNVITWKLLGSIDSIDHFVIMKESLGVRTLVGKAHSEFLHGNCQYLHPVSRRDIGAFSYVIVPIFNNYETGTEVITNTVIVEPMPITKKSTSNDVR
jgi:hypothetical protein